MGLYSVGDRLGKTLGELAEMPVAELNGWLAFYCRPEGAVNGE
jgi:hypothetical protein